MAVLISLLRTALAAVTGFLLLLGSFFGPHITATNPAPVATSTTAATTTAATSPPAKTVTQTTKPKVVEQKSGLPAGAPAGTRDPRTFVEVPSAEPAFNAESLNTLARASLVNILCTTGSGGSFNPISASGVIVDSRGIILTNAHVGQFFLLRDYPTPGNVQCVIRTGSPAAPRYTAELLYLPAAWIRANASKIASTSPTGTGENDYAFLYITGTTNPQNTLPASFPALSLDANEPDTGQQMLVAAYPAGFLGGISITLNLYTTSAVATVGKLYTFSGADEVDLFSLGGTVVSQSGSSGGAVVNAAGKLDGLISTEVPADTTAGRDLRAITIAHIDRSLVNDNQGGVRGLLSQNPAGAIADFAAKVAPGETKALEDALNQ